MWDVLRGCAYCKQPHQRMRSQGQFFKFCSPECDAKAMSERFRRGAREARMRKSGETEYRNLMDIAANIESTDIVGAATLRSLARRLLNGDCPRCYEHRKAAYQQGYQAGRKAAQAMPDEMCARSVNRTAPTEQVLGEATAEINGDGKLRVEPWPLLAWVLDRRQFNEGDRVEIVARKVSQ